MAIDGGGDDDGEGGGGGGGRAAGAVLQLDPGGEAVAACGRRGRPRVAAQGARRRGTDDHAGAKRPGRPLRRLHESSTPPLRPPAIDVMPYVAAQLKSILAECWRNKLFGRRSLFKCCRSIYDDM
jgi:hypothetical protein